MSRKGIRGILVAIYLVAMFIALILGMSIYQITTADERLANKYLDELEITRTSEAFLKLMIEQVEESSLELLLESEIISAFETENIEDNVEARKLLDQWIVHHSIVESVHMMTLKGQFLSVANVSMDKAQAEKIIKQFSKETIAHIEAAEEGIYVGIGNRYLQADHMRGKEEKTLFVARQILTDQSLNHAGYMFYFLDYEMLQEKLLSYLEHNQLQLLLVDEKNQILSFDTSTTLGEAYTDYLKGTMSEKEQKEWEMPYHHAEIESELGLKVIGKYTVNPPNNELLNILTAFSMISLIFLMVNMFAIRQIVVNPLEQISSSAKRISDEGISMTRFEVNSIYREGNIIVDALNDMLEKLHTLRIEAEERERQRRVLELSVINHQVNPHFLFNTLNSVSLLIAVEDKKSALDLVKGLAHYYRVCLSQENNVNTIEQELAIMKEYVHIIELKNPDLIRLRIEVDESAYSKKIPRMILQTLVENSIKYGIKTTEEPLEILIRIQVDHEKHRTAIMIWDNGKGMASEIREDILKGVSLKDKSGFGISGTIKRIGLMYEIAKIDEIIEIDSVLDEYTCIKFYIPW